MNDANQELHWLVLWNMFFPYYFEIIGPADELIFRGDGNYNTNNI